MSNWEEAYQIWQQAELDYTMKNELEKLKADKQALEDAFFESISFGTGGMRGILGPGINRMNIYTIRKVVKGLAFYLEKNQVNYQDRGVVIAYDSRYMSQQFAIQCAKVLGYHGIKTYVFSEIKPTPLLSFAVRYLRTGAGIMITASHNPPEYNGFKVYNEQGSQISLQETEDIVHEMNKIEDIFQIPVLDEEALEADHLLEWVNGEVDHAYLEQLLEISKLSQDAMKKQKDLQIVFTPLHGTAVDLVPNGIKQLHFPNIHIVQEQMIRDPEFSTVVSPNPEEHQAFERAVELGEAVQADVLLATDPDADRLGVAAKNKEGHYQVLTGNQLGSLLLDYILKHTDPQVLSNARMIKTIVTTELGRAVANAYGVPTLDTLTGFKYIGEKINEFDATGETFIFGFEESYGYLIRGFSRDKDAVQTATMTCEMAHYWKNQQKTLFDALEELYKIHGFYKEGLDSLTLEGKAGKEQINRIVDQFRYGKVKYIEDLRVISMEDYQASTRVYMDEEEKIERLTLPKENVVKYKLENNCWICLRPSGTEPKVKFYYGVYGKTKEEATKNYQMIRQAVHVLMQQKV